MNKPKMKIDSKTVKIVATVFLLGIVMGILIVQAPTLNFVISGGPYPGAPEYTVWLESGTYYAKDANGRITHSGTNATTVIQAIENIVDDVGGIIYLKDVQLPTAVVLSANIIVKESYQGEINYYNEYNIKHSILKPYFVDDAMFQCELMWERGEYYNGKTYICYQNDELDPYIIFYNHNRQYWSEPVKVGDNPLTADAHGTPSMIVDFAGYIHVFWGSHSGTGQAKHSKSTNPEDISAWTAKADMPPGASATYPHVVKTATRIYYFYRDTVGADTTYDYVYSNDNGESWSSENTAVSGGSGWGNYQGNAVYDSLNNRIYIIWTFFNNGNASRTQWNYIAYLDVASGSMVSMGGNNMGPTIDLAEACAYCDLADAGSGNKADNAIIRLNSAKTPYVLFTIYNSSNHWIPYFTKWTGAAWSTPVNVIHQKASALERDFLLVSDSILEAYITINPVPPGYGGSVPISGPVDLYISADAGATWFYNRTILNQPLEGLRSKGARVIGNFQTDLKIIIQPAHDVFYGTEIFNWGSMMYAWGDNGFVYRRYSWPS